MTAALDVSALPRRTAHAVHALLAIRNDPSLGPYGPFKASEVVLYDSEALSARSTGRALAHALRLGLADRWGPGLWVATNFALDHRSALEERYLADTERGDDRP